MLADSTTMVGFQSSSAEAFRKTQCRKDTASRIAWYTGSAKGRWLLVCLILACATQALAAKPNVVLVITDDQGYGDLSCHGNPILKTPNIDALYRESVRLVDYHVAPTCSPSRAALQSGHWTDRVRASGSSAP